VGGGGEREGGWRGGVFRRAFWRISATDGLGMVPKDSEEAPRDLPAISERSMDGPSCPRFCAVSRLPAQPLPQKARADRDARTSDGRKLNVTRRSQCCESERRHGMEMTRKKLELGLTCQRLLLERGRTFSPQSRPPIPCEGKRNIRGGHANVVIYRRDTDPKVHTMWRLQLPRSAELGMKMVDGGSAAMDRVCGRGEAGGAGEVGLAGMGDPLCRLGFHDTIRSYSSHPLMEFLPTQPRYIFFSHYTVSSGQG
jgi:hypothetical protein